MRINFPTTGVIDATANRLQKHLQKVITIDVARNIVCKCYGYNNYVELQNSFSSATPQLNSLSQEQILSLRKQQIDVVTSSLRIAENKAEGFCMAMSPYIELGESNRNLKIGQIGRYTKQWYKPDSYGNITEQVNVYIFVIAIRCGRCKGTGMVDLIEQYFDLENPPIYSYGSQCKNCDGTGVDHHRDAKLNKIRLTRKELKLQHEYYKDCEDLENSYYHQHYHNYSDEDSYTGWDLEHDEDNPEMELDGFEEEEN